MADVIVLESRESGMHRSPLMVAISKARTLIAREEANKNTDDEHVALKNALNDANLEMVRGYLAHRYIDGVSKYQYGENDIIIVPKGTKHVPPLRYCANCDEQTQSCFSHDEGQDFCRNCYTTYPTFK